MKLKQLGLLGLCGLLLCGCTNLKATSNPENNPTDETKVIDSAGNDTEMIIKQDDEIIVPEIIETPSLEESEIPVIQETEKPKEETTTAKTEDKKETIYRDETQHEDVVIEDSGTKEEDIPVDSPDPMPEPTPTPTHEEPKKEEPKVEEEIKYGGWHESDKVQSVFNKINKIRSENGLSELPWSEGDTGLADIRVEELVSEVANGTVHAGLKKYDRYVGEIAGYGYGASGVVDAWMNSTGHANQILADYNTSMAVGVYYDEYTSSSYYIVIFR